MIVDPDFLDYWRTRMVVDALGGDELAPTYILRLWAHCQARKSDRHAMPPAGLKAQCRAPHDAALFEQALTDAGFVLREEGCIHVLGWAEQNASLLAAWENGAKGGRPPKPKQNPRVTDVPQTGDAEKPTGNPAVTHGEPKPNPGETDKSREEKNSPSLRSGEARAARDPACPDDVVRQTWTDWVQLRKGHKAKVSETVVAEARKEAAKANLTLQRFLEIWCLRGSRGLAAEWLKPHELRAQAPPPEPAWRAEQRQRTQLAAPGVAAQDAARFFDMEATDVTPQPVGRSHLRQADPDLRPVLPAPVDRH